MYFKLCHAGNYNPNRRSKSAVKYIVLHYTANDGDTARNNVDYYARTKLPRPASAHYFVDETEIACSVPWDCIAWHCGGNRYKGTNPQFYGKCSNYNSIGIEMCSRLDGGGGFYIPKETQKRAAKFVARLMKEYDVDMDHVIRHYDVTGKRCPAPMVGAAQWAEFKNLVNYYYNGGDDMYIEKLGDIPAGELRDTVKECVEKGIVRGTGDGLHLTMDMVRCLVFCKRMIEKGV